MSTHAADTWGIPSEDFLYGYIAMSVTLMVLTLVWRLMIRARRYRHSAEHGYSAEQLTPPEVGMLTGASRALAASLAILRSADLITTDGAVLRPLGPGDETLDWYTLTVYQRLAQQALPHRRRQLAERMTVETARLRNSLADRGYLTSDSARRSIFLSTVPLKILVAVGIVRIAFGLHNDKPVEFLILAVLVTGFSIPLLGLNFDRTTSGKAARSELTTAHAYLSPRNKPAFSAYGPRLAGMSAALFAGSAMLMINPALASAAGIGADGSGSSGGSDGGGSDGGGSSCSGGGGCGGGGGGCGG
ncbi:TIGR04222 domain-containing membrane protein [uncultured Rhodococcus sp.]|uniref:TIGR04222 domain-containing membrane protein n=1 Tax=uncultured Rhodococcus sp. TaxID=194249 RepID=UPI0028DCFD65|nr:TIGR04222 domain-containing membrane protein [uncultured Rhodococcus sp.]